MSEHALTSYEVQLLRVACNSEVKIVNIRLREGEYQFDLTKAIASSELEAYFPDVKDLIKKLYGESRMEDIQFIRKIQTILKKMEKSGIVSILPKKKPWELQRYALSSFKFQDSEKNLVVLATELEVKKILDLVNSSASMHYVPTTIPSHIKGRILFLTLLIITSYSAILWTLTQPTINAVILMLAFSIAALCSILLGIAISRRR